LEVKQKAGGRLFHTCGPATANAGSQMDVQRVGGTTRSKADDDGADDVWHC